MVLAQGQLTLTFTNIETHARFEVFAAVDFEVVVFWAVTPYNDVTGYPVRYLKTK
jgi:hypothetical protein